jgi:hypothetical protein
MAFFLARRMKRGADHRSVAPAREQLAPVARLHLLLPDRLPIPRSSAMGSVIAITCFYDEQNHPKERQ